MAAWRVLIGGQVPDLVSSTTMSWSCRPTDRNSEQARVRSMVYTRESTKACSPSGVPAFLRGRAKKTARPSLSCPRTTFVWKRVISSWIRSRRSLPRSVAAASLATQVRYRHVWWPEWKSMVARKSRRISSTSSAQSMWWTASRRAVANRSDSDGRRFRCPPCRCRCCVDRYQYEYEHRAAVSCSFGLSCSTSHRAVSYAGFRHSSS
mmetsp:Transcript_26812/g.63018  ORF Transcript_26812/g.63018 Transcript_26812/m.63018 type:complete len:207 (-) Transcript_26812:49-669(-)